MTSFGPNPEISITSLILLAAANLKSFLYSLQLESYGYHTPVYNSINLTVSSCCNFITQFPSSDIINALSTQNTNNRILRVAALASRFPLIRQRLKIKHVWFGTWAIMFFPLCSWHQRQTHDETPHSDGGNSSNARIKLVCHTLWECGFTPWCCHSWTTQPQSVACVAVTWLTCKSSYHS